MTTPPIAAVVVVIPAHDEQALIDRSLAAMDVAVRRAADRGIRSLVRVVLDDCTDDSRLIASRHPFALVTLSARAVGAARAAGVEDALADLADVPAERIWLAHTDADSAVPPNWIIAQVAAADGGADVFLGTVRPDFADLSPAHRRHWLQTHPVGMATGNTHGANLGIRASIYRATGGFAPVVEHEDVMLVEQCRRIGATVHASGAAEVLTSGRGVGRTPGGYAGFVREQARIFGGV